MAYPPSEVLAAQKFAERAGAMLVQTPSFQQLDPATRRALVRDLSTIQQALTPPARPPEPVHDPYALALETPNDLARRRSLMRQGVNPNNGVGEPAEASAGEPGAGKQPGPRVAATEAIAARAGALSDEIDFPAFVANLIHGTFDAIVDASIRQMEAFAELVSAVAKDVDRFTSENVTPNQVRDWLVQQYPRDLELTFASGQPRLHRRPTANGDETEAAPAWLADYGLGDQELTDELIEEQVIPAARRRVGENRLQMLATMVLMGMNRINVKDGSISARLRFRAAARDKAAVDYAVSQDPGGQGWGSRGSATYAQSAMMVSTVGVNVQAEADLKAELFGEVKINFVSETLPLERFVDAAQLTLLQRNAHAPANTSAAQPGNPPSAAPPASTPGSGGT